MRIVADTNVLLRAFVEDDPAQTQIARVLIAEADSVIIGRHAFCELAWVLSTTYKFPKNRIADLIRELRYRENVVTDRAAVDAGLSMLTAGGDFADGVIAYEGRWLGGETFVSFDKRAVALVANQGHEAKLLG
jgi:predicted nucleic-acid-binding protein